MGLAGSLATVSQKDSFNTETHLGMEEPSPTNGIISVNGRKAFDMERGSAITLTAERKRGHGKMAHSWVQKMGLKHHDIQ